MLIQIGERTREFMNILGLTNYPFFEKEIKTKFQMELKKYHPDVNKNLTKEEATKRTQKIIEAYNEIKNLALSDITGKQTEEAITKIKKDEDIFNLYDTCPECNGRGYYMRKEGRDYCFICFNTGKTKRLCKSCRGTGRFKQRSGRIVDCYTCKGKGTVEITCPWCHGNLGTKTVKIVCHRCEGVGKVKLDLWNPVIKKGAVL